MANNILSAVIDVKAPGVVQTTNQVAKGLDGVTNALEQTEKSLKNIQGGTVKLNSSFNTIASGTRTVTRATKETTSAIIDVGRVIQDAPYALLSGNISAVANNFDPLFISLQRAFTAAGSTTEGFKQLAKSLIGVGGVGLAISAVSSFLVLLQSGFFNTKTNTEDSEAALRKYTEAAEAAGKAVDDLSSSLNFLNKIGSLNIKIRGLGEVLDLQGQVVSQRQQTADIVAQRQKLQQDLSKINADEDLNNKDRAEALKKTNDQIEDLYKKERESARNEAVLYQQIQLQRNEDAKKAEDDRKNNYEKYVNDIISKAKQLQSEFPSLFPKNDQGQDFIFGSALDSQIQKFDKAIVALRKFDDALANSFSRTGTGVGITAQVQVEAPPLPELVPVAQETIDKLSTLFKATPLPVVVNPIITLDSELLRQKINGILSEALANLAVSVGETIGDAITGSFDGVGAIITVLGDLLTNIGKALIQIGIAKEILDKITFVKGSVAIIAGIAAVAAGKAFKNVGRRAVGGQVMPDGSYLVGERGPERFVPNTGGSIIPNNRLGSFAGMAGGMNGGGTITLRLAGNDLVAAFTLNQLKQGRLS